MIRSLLVNRKNREKVAIIENDKEVRYIDLINKALALQKILGERKQENIAILLPNSGDYIAAFWATIGAGMTAFPLNVLMTRHELVPLLRHTGVRIVITRTAYRRLFEEMAAVETLSLKIIYMEEFGETPGRNEFEISDSDPCEPMVLLHTSGTTGKCKIVQLSERNVEASVLGYLDKLRLEEMDVTNARFILAAPFSSVYGVPLDGV